MRRFSSKTENAKNFFKDGGVATGLASFVGHLSVSANERVARMSERVDGTQTHVKPRARSC